MVYNCSSIQHTSVIYLCMYNYDYTSVLFKYNVFSITIYTCRLKNSQLKLFESKTALERTQKKVQSNNYIDWCHALNLSSPISPITLRVYCMYMYILTVNPFMHSTCVCLCLPICIFLFHLSVLCLLM